MGSEILPPLDNAIVTEVNGLWPKMQWTQPLRQEWRTTLARHETPKVLRALRDHFAASEGRRPSLKSVRILLQATPQPGPQFDPGFSSMELERARQAATKRIMELDDESWEALRLEFKSVMRRDLDRDPDSWLSNTSMILAAILDTDEQVR